MKNKVFILGSINVDFVISANRIPKQGETISGYDFFEAVGGKGGNQAVAIARNETESILIGSVGRDYQGQLALKTLNDAGVDSTYVNYSDDDHTGVAMIVKTDSDNRIIINQGANASVEEHSIEAALATATEGDFFLTQFEVPLYSVFDGLSKAKQKNITTVVNPAPAVVMNDDFYPLIDYLIVNQSEAEILSGIFPTTVESCKESARILQEKGTSHIVITLGSDGSVYICNDEVIEVPSYKVDVLDTTGAGDTFIGTMISSLAKGYKIDKALDYASAAGALACTKQGAQVGIPSLPELEAFMRRRKI